MLRFIDLDDRGNTSHMERQEIRLATSDQLGYQTVLFHTKSKLFGKSDLHTSLDINLIIFFLSLVIYFRSSSASRRKGDHSRTRR